MFLAELQVINKGNTDIAEFDFGVTLGEGDQCIYVEIAPPDRHHAVALQAGVMPEAPRREIDFKLRPFNRGDSYSLKLYVVIPGGEIEPKAITLGSPHPVRFVDMPSMGEVLARAASEAVLKVGPVQVVLGHRR